MEPVRELPKLCNSTQTTPSRRKKRLLTGETDLRQVDEVGQDGRVMDVEVSLQLIPDGLAQQLQAAVGSLCILLCARANWYPLGGIIVGCLSAQRAAWLLLTPRTIQRAAASTPTYTNVQALAVMVCMQARSQCSKVDLLETSSRLGRCSRSQEDMQTTRTCCSVIMRLLLATCFQMTAFCTTTSM